LPRELKDREKMNQMDLSLQRRLLYADEGEDMLNRIVTVTIMDASLPTRIEAASVQWKHTSSHSTKTFKVTP
jgi:hypothetical protein